MVLDIIASSSGYALARTLSRNAAKAEGCTVLDMKNDCKAVFPFGSR
jgi:hypothetical protein